VKRHINIYQASRRYLNILKIWPSKTLTVNIKKGTTLYKQQQKGNMGLNHKALEISISSKAISFPQSDPKGNSAFEFLLSPCAQNREKTCKFKKVHMRQK